MSACANCAPKCGRFSAYIAHFVCIAPRAFYLSAPQSGIEPTTEGKIGLSPTDRGAGFKAFDIWVYFPYVIF